MGDLPLPMRRTPISYGILIPLLLGGALLVALLSRSSSWFRAALLPPNNTQQIQDIYGNSVVSRVSLGYGDSVQVETGIQYLVHCPTDGAPSGYGFHSPVDFDVPGLRIYEYTAQQSDERDKAKSGKARWNGRTFGYDVNDDLDVFEQGKVYLVSAAEPFEFSCTGTGLGGGSSSSAGNSSSTGIGSSSSSAFVGQLSCTSPVVAITPAVIPDELLGTYPYLMPGHAVWSTDQNKALIFTRFHQGKVWSFNPTTNAFTSQTFNTGTMPSGFSSMTIESAVWNSIRNEAYIFMKSGSQTRMFVFAPSSGIPVDKGVLPDNADVSVFDAKMPTEQTVYLYSRATGSFNAYDVLSSTYRDLSNTLPSPSGSYYDELKDNVASAAVDPETHFIYFTASALKVNGGTYDQEDMYFYKFDTANDVMALFPQYLSNSAPQYNGNALAGMNLIRTSPPREKATIAWNELTKTMLIFGGHELVPNTSKSLRLFTNSFDPRINYDIIEFDPRRGLIQPRPEILPSARADVTAVWDSQNSIFYLMGGGAGYTTVPSYVTNAPWDNNNGFDNGSLLPATASSLPSVEHQVVTARICSMTQDPASSCSQYNLPPQITLQSSYFAGSPVAHATPAKFVHATDATNDPITYFIALSAHHFGTPGAGDAQTPNLIYPPYDVNTDSMVDIGDVNAIGMLIGRNQGQSGYNPRADLNNDGSITQADISAFFSGTSAAISAMFGNDFSFNTSTGQLDYSPQINPPRAPLKIDVTVSAYTSAPCFPLRYSSLQTIISKPAGG